MNTDKQKLISNILEILQALIEEIIEEKLNNINSKGTSQKPFMSLDEAATYLNLSKNTLYAYNNRRTIPFRKTGKSIYYKLEDLDAYVLRDSKHIKSKAEIKTAFDTANTQKSLKRFR